MTIDEVETELLREPFVPFRVHLDNGKRYDIAFREAARLLTFGFLVFIGKKEGTHRAEGYDRFPYEQIVKIEHRRVRGRHHPKKTS
jgi:hypothetical protein